MRPLRLKSQEVNRIDTEVALDRPYVKVWVDTSVSHLDGVFDYLIPERLSAVVQAGIRVGVPFSGRDVEALVIERCAGSSVTNLKFISSVISQSIVAKPALINLIALSARRWICNPYDLIRSAIPTRVASVDKVQDLSESGLDPKEAAQRVQGAITYLHLTPHENSLQRLAEFALTERKKGSVLIILPEDREVYELSKKLGDEVIVLSSSLTRTQRYSNYLCALVTTNEIIIGTRSAIFVTPKDLRSLVIYRENSQSHYEVRHPGWNVRDMALLRHQSEGIDLYFAGFSPSLEMANLIEDNSIKFLRKKSRLQVLTFAQQNSELLPERIFKPIRDGLKTGSVLFLVPKKGYASALMCKKCKNLATCTCGGKLSRSAPLNPPQCVHCSTKYANWKCSWCGEDKLILLGRGAIRFGEEIGRAFPGFPVVNSDSDAKVREFSGGNSLVIATQGMAPECVDGYSVVVLLEGAAFFSYSDLRGQERSREAFFEAASKVKYGGPVLIAIDSSHPIVAALSTWNPSHMYKRELTELGSLDLPPSRRALTIDVAIKEATSLVDGFKKALLDSRLPVSSKIMGPAMRPGEQARILLTASLADFPALTIFISEYIKHRAITKKDPVQVWVDPYSLS